MYDFSKYPNVSRAFQYAYDVKDGRRLACTYVRGAVDRFFNDLKRQDCELCSFYFDIDKAERFLRLVQKFNHVKGEWKTPHLYFENWQCFIFTNIYGFIDKRTKSRRFRTAHIQIPRGNGKSALASVCGLYHLSLENPKGNEVYSSATKKDQARIVLDSARAMAKANKKYLKATGTEVFAHHIAHEKSNSFFKALSADADSLDGLQPALSVIDELHSHKDRKVYDVMDSAMSKRPDSLSLIITTAGFSTSGVGYSETAYCKRICSQDIEDDTFFGIIYTIDEKDDPFDSSSWEKANPNWGVSVDPINFESKCKKAQESPESENNFLVKHLNIWSNAFSAFFNVKRWSKLGDKGLQLSDFEGESAWGGIDLASMEDLSSFAYIFKPEEKYYIFTKDFLPEARLLDHKRNKNLYHKFKKEGSLIVTNGESINYPKLQEILLKDSLKYNIQGVHFDPWNASEFAQRMSMENIEMIEFRMSTGNLSEPTKRLNALILENLIGHCGSSLLAWCISNVVAKRDANDNVFPRKEHEYLKIDSAISVIMALAGLMADLEEKSIYEERGILVF